MKNKSKKLLMKPESVVETKTYSYTGDEFGTAKMFFKNGEFQHCSFTVPSGTVREYTEKDLEFLALIASQVKLTIKHEKLKHESKQRLIPNVL